MSTSAPMKFHYSVVRVVPDPIKDEAVNVGVIVIAETGPSSMRVKAPRARIRAMQRTFSFEGLEHSMTDLARAVGIDLQFTLGEETGGDGRSSVDRLATVASSLANQIQLTEPRVYLAQDGKDAADRLFQRYVARRSSSSKAARPLTHAVLKAHIWQVIKEWQHPHIRVQANGLLRGQDADHPVDFVVHNGHPRAAMVALATHSDDMKLSYLYRDSIPTIAADMGDDFQVYAVLPTEAAIVTADEKQFAAETEKLLAAASGVRTVRLDELKSVEGEVIRLLL